MVRQNKADNAKKYWNDDEGCPMKEARREIWLGKGFAGMGQVAMISAKKTAQSLEGNEKPEKADP
jgi:hypothetical protein